MKHAIAFSMALMASITTLAAPLQWICDWPEAKSQTFSLYQGETATFEPTFRVNGRTVTNATIEAVWYQTNGMANAWWKLDGATFAPSNDVGAASYRFFVEAKASGDTIYRANGALRMLPSPGFTPNAIEPPVQTLDFATIDVLHAPWATPDDLAAAADELHGAIADVAAAKADATKEVVTTRWRFDATGLILEPDADDSWAADDANYMQYVADRGVYRWTIAGYGAGLCYGGADAAALTNATGAAYTFTRLSATNQYDVAYMDDVAAAVAPLCTIEAAEAMRAAESNRVDSLLGDYLPRTTSAITAAGVTTDYLINSSYAGGIRVRYSSSSLNNYTSYGYRGVTARRNNVGEDWLWDATDANGIVRRKELAGITTEETDPTVPSWAKAATKPGYTAAEVGAATTEDVYRLVAGTNVVLVITNYNSAVHAPSMKLQRLDPETGEYVTYWDETRRHGLTLTNAMDYTDRATNELARTKADRAWGKYTSATGIDAPSDTLWISHPNTVLAPGLDWTREVTAGGEIFVLTSNGMALEFENNPTNAAYFNIASNGETIFRIEKTDSRLVYVNISDCQVVGNYLLVGFTGWRWPTHPLLRVKSDLSNDDWLKEEDAVDNAWAGVARFEWSGDGVNTPFVVSIENITGGDRIFAGFSFTAPGETKIINNGVTDLSGGVYHNGQKYVPTVSGDELKFIRQQ